MSRLVADFSSLLKGTKSGPRKPRIVKMPLSAWADSRSDKPTEPVEIGVRLLSEEDVQIARSSAAKIAVELTPVCADDDRIAAYNDALMRVAAERGTCSPKDAEDPYFVMGELEIRQRMTPEGVRLLWQEIEALHLSGNPSLPEIDDDGLAHLFALVYRDCLDRLATEDGARVRRLLELCRSTLEEVDTFAAATG